MAEIKKVFNASSLPIAFSRGNPIPIDKSSVWYSKTDMENYAKTGATAYVGQILALVDDVNNTSTAYIITDTTGALKEVGSATVGDNKTIVLNDGALSLKNWGVEYYRWVDAVGEEGQEGYVAGHHEKQIVDETHPWIAGLEPKAIAGTDGTFEIAWYQPSTTTIEGLNSALGSLQTSVNEINSALGNAETVGTIRGDIKANNDALATKLALAGGTMTGDIILTDGGKAISDTAVAGLIASAGHIKRTIVEVLPEASTADANTVYMVKDATVTSGDAYNDYMLIDGALVQVGGTSVDLSGYATTEAVSEVQTALNNHKADTTLHITNEERSAWNNKVDKAEGKSLVADEQITKLSGLANIKTIGKNLSLSEDGVLAALAEQYTLPAATASDLGGVKKGDGLSITTEGVLAVQLNTEKANGLAVSTDGLELALASDTTAGAMSAAEHVKLANLVENAQANIIEGALLGTVAATIDENKNLVIPVATETALGLVKGSKEDNEITIQGNGEMEVNRLSVGKLFVPENEEFIINGGNA